MLEALPGFCLLLLIVAVSALLVWGQRVNEPKRMQRHRAQMKAFLAEQWRKTQQEFEQMPDVVRPATTKETNA